MCSDGEVVQYVVPKAAGWWPGGLSSPGSAGAVVTEISRRGPCNTGHGPELSCFFAVGSGPECGVQGTGTDLLSKCVRAVAN